MNQHTTFPGVGLPRVIAQERILARRDAKRANIDRLITRLGKLRENPDSGHRWLQATDAAQFVWDADFSEEIANTLQELRLSEEGYPLDSDGDVQADADREWIPCERVMPRGSL